MSGGSGSTTQTSGPPGYAVPTAGGLLALINQTLASQGQKMPANLNQGVASLTPDQQQALAGIAGLSNVAGGLGGTGANYLSGLLEGKQLNPESNPFLQGTYNEAAQAMTNQYQTGTAPSQAAFAEQSSGGGPLSTQGSANQQEVALNQYNYGQNLNNLATNIFGGAYEQGVQNQLSGLGALGATQSALYQPAQELLGAGQYQQQQQQNVLNTQYQNALSANQYPWQQLTRGAGIFGDLFGNSTQVNTSPSGSK